MITLPLPPTTNNTYRHAGHFVFMTKKAKLWISECGWLVKKGMPKIVTPITSITITYFLKRERDVDGSHKIVIDLLASMGMMPDDSQLTELHLYKKWDKDNPRLEITWL